MAELANKHTERLKELKETIEEAQIYFADNVKRYEKFMNFVFKSSVTDDEAASLASTGKPTIEFNILESFISRLRGEFAKQEPSLTVRAADGIPTSFMTPQFSETMDIVEAHLRSVFFNGTNDMLDYNIYTDLLAGGFSVMRVYTDYINEKSFEQNIYVERVFDPTLTVFDPLAKDSHKGDGRFCAELYPMTKKQFEEEYGESAAKDIKFTRNLSGFNWSFQNEKEEIVLLCEYYEKKRRKETIVKLSNGHTVTKKEYQELLKEWDERGFIEQPPVPVNERKTIIEYICRYRFCETAVLDYIETNYKYFPLVFVDGNSVHLKIGAAYTQMTRPYVYHAEGIQRLKNFAGQSLANELENTVQHKFKVAIESIPEDYLDAYQNVQKADVLMYNCFLDSKNPQVTLPPPQEIMRTPIPPEISNTFRMSDEMTQTILGSFDTSQGMASSQLSGIAFARSAIQSNNASVPYIVGFIKGLNRVAQIYVDLIPKYYRTPRSMPIMKPDGKRDYMMINKSGSLYMNFDPNSMLVKVETGVNYTMQKEIALQTIISLTQASQGFAQFFNDEGLPILLDNIDIKGIDQLKEKASGWMQKQKEQQAQAQQQAMQAQQSQMQSAQQQQQMQSQSQQMQMQMQQMKMAEMQKELQAPSKGQLAMMDLQNKVKVDEADIAIKSQDSETAFLDTISKIRMSDAQIEIKKAEIQAEHMRSAVDMAIHLDKQEQDRMSNK